MPEPTDPSRGEMVLYQAPDGTVELDVRLDRETLWLSQKQMSVLFDKDSDTIGLHLRNIFEEEELNEVSTTEESSVVQMEGKRQVRRKVKFFNLDAIISVGYRVNSKRGTQFRIWATRVLHQHILEGYTVNSNRLRDLNRAVRLISEVVERRERNPLPASRREIGLGRGVGGDHADDLRKQARREGCPRQYYDATIVR